MFSPSQARGWDNRFRDDSDEYDSENDDEPGPFMERKAPRRTTQLVASTGTRGTNLELAPGSSMRDALPRSASIHNLNITSPIPTEHHLGDNAGQGRPTSRRRATHFDLSRAAKEAREASNANTRPEGEAPLRGLAKHISVRDWKQTQKKTSRGYAHSKDKGKSFDISSGGGPLSARRFPHTRSPSTTAHASAMSGGARSGATALQGLPLVRPHSLEVSNRMQQAAADAAVRPPETPPLLKVTTQRPDLFANDQSLEQDNSEKDLRIGEIKSVSLDEEIAIVRKAAVLIVLSLVAALLLRYFYGRVSERVNVIKMVGFVSLLLLTFPVIRFTARLFAYILTVKASRLLYRGNGYYFLVALHYDIAITLWSVLSVHVWYNLYKPWVFNTEQPVSRTVYRYGYNLLQCHLALRGGILAKNFLVLLVATWYLWRPYLRRVQSSILAQYILLLLTDYCTKDMCSSDDINFAMEMVQQGIDDKKNISLYAVSKAMGFIPRNKLGHSFFTELGGHDTLDSTKDATVLGRFLYRDLVRRSKIVNNPTPLNSVRRGGMGGGGTHTVGNTLRAAGEDMRRSLLSIRYTNTSGATNNGEGGSSQESDKKGSGSLGPAIAQRVASNTLANAPAGALVDRNGMISLAEEVKEEKSAVEASASATARTPLQMAAAAVVAASAGGRMSASSESKDELTSGIVLPKRSGQWSGMETAEGTAHLSGQAVAAIRQEVAVEVDEYDATNASSSASSSDAEGEEDGGILRADASFCPYLPDLLLEVAFKIFDLENDGVITKEEMVLGVVGTYKDHRSLAHTLQDSEHVARKLGLIIMAVILFILMFVWLSIWGADVLSLSLTFSSFLIAFSFAIGTSASNLMASILFIFVSRLYDVGDRVHIYNDGQLNARPADLTVVKVDLMTTVFRRWDEQVFYIPNHLLAGKTIVNIQRTAHQWHEFYIQVGVSTPSQKLKALHTALQAFSKSKDKPEGLYSRMGFSLANIENSAKLSIRITFRQKGNWQIMEKKWACQSMCTWAIKNACESLEISYTTPPVPLLVKDKII